MLLANKHFTPVVGLDIHIVTLPPGVPTPLPHPFIGFVMDVMDYVPFIGSKVNINFVPRGIADTSGMLAIKTHIPMGGPFVMAPMIAHEAVNFFGSVTVKADNVALSPAGYMLMSCNDIGMPLSLSPGKKMKPVPSMYLPSSTTIPLPMGKPVMVGGPYAPDLLGVLKQLAMSYGFGALMKGLGAGMKKALTKLNHSIPKNKFTKGLKESLCKLGFEPVDLVDGRMVYNGQDFELPGPLPVKWERRWYSDSSYEGPLGYGFHHSYDLRLELDFDADVILIILPDGRPVGFPLLLAEESTFYHRSEKLSLTCLSADYYTLKDHSSQQTYTFMKLGNTLYRPVSLRNQNGQEITFQYNTRQQLVQITDTAKREIRLTLDKEDRIVHIAAHHEGQKLSLVSYRYHESGDLAAIDDALGQPTIMKYVNHLMTAKSDRNGQTFYWEYDGSRTGARVIHTWGDGGILEGWIQYGKGKNTTINSLKEQTIYYYNADKLCTQITDPLGNSIFHEYTPFSEPYRDIDAEGNMTGYTYDPKGNLKTVTQPDGSITTFIYDEEGRLTLTIDPESGNTLRVYDEETARLNSLIGKDHSVTSFEYNDNGLIRQIRDNKDEYTRLEYDQDHNLVRVTLPGGTETSFKYDVWGRCQETVNAEEQHQYFSYDLLGRVTQVHLPDSNIIKLQYNAYDEVILAKDKKHQVNFEYTPLGSLKLREEKGNKVHFHYNTEEQLQAIVNERGDAYRFGRNPNGEIIREEGFDGLTRKYIRDRAGKVIRVDRPDNRFSEYEYDLNGRLTRTQYSDGTWETYSYDRVGRLIEAVNENSHIKLQRDPSGKILQEEQDGYLVTSAYDKLGQRIQVTSSLGAEINLQLNLSGFVEHMQASRQEGTWQASIKYNSLGQELERISGKVTNEFSYDFGGRVKEQKTQNQNRIQRHKQYDWSPNDKLYKITDILTKGSQTFEYDTFDNLIQSLTTQNGRSTKEGFFRDDVGNIFNKEDKSDRKYTAGGKLIKNNDTKYEYDLEGNLIHKFTPEGTWNYEWSGNGMLKKVSRPDKKIITFEYDALGRRTAKIFGLSKDTNVSNPRGLPQNEVITRWVWDGNTPLHEWSYNPNDRPKTVVDELGMLAKDREEPTENMTTWVFDEGSFKPAAKIEGVKTYSIINDYLGTPQGAYDAQGEKVWACELHPYGKVKTCTDTTFIPFRYQGQYEDVETGLYYNRFRYYAPEEGMYMSQDPIGLAGGNKLYNYVKDVNIRIDPLGLVPFTMDQQALIDLANEVSNKGKSIISSIDADILIEFGNEVNSGVAQQVKVLDHRFASGNNPFPGHYAHEGPGGHIHIHNKHISC